MREVVVSTKLSESANGFNGCDYLGLVLLVIVSVNQSISVFAVSYISFRYPLAFKQLCHRLPYLMPDVCSQSAEASVEATVVAPIGRRICVIAYYNYMLPVCMVKYYSRLER